MAAPPFDLAAYEPPLSLWSLVEPHVPAHEHEEVKAALGQSMVEESLELHMEVSTLLDIWRDYRAETTAMERTRSFLPEPPVARDRLRAEIQFFVQSIREKAEEQGRDEEAFLSIHNKDVLNYAHNGVSPGSSRPQTSHGRDGRETPMAPATPGSDRSSGVPAFVSDEVEAVSDKLNFLNIGEVVQHLRDHLESEIRQLKRDIEFLQQCLEEEASFRDTQEAGGPEPSLKDLRDERSKLERTLLKKDEKTSAVPGAGASRHKMPPARPTHVTKMDPPTISRASFRKTQLLRAQSAKEAGQPDTRRGPVRPVYSPAAQPTADILRLEDVSPRDTARAAWEDTSDYSPRTDTPSFDDSDSDYSSGVSRPGSGLQPDLHSTILRGSPQRRVSSVTRRLTSKVGPVGIPPPLKVGRGKSLQSNVGQGKSQLPERPGSAQRFRRMVMENRQNEN